MKVIVAGSRNITNRYAVEKAITESGFQIDELVCGMCGSGADLIAYLWASPRLIPIKEFPADWETSGKKAGPIRNQRMVNYADALIAIWDGQSAGTKDVIEKAKKKKLKIYIKVI